MASIDQALKNLETALSELKAVLVQEEILVQAEDSGELVTNQDPEAMRPLTMR